jgi:hypothetical protein
MGRRWSRAAARRGRGKERLNEFNNQEEPLRASMARLPLSNNGNESGRTHACTHTPQRVLARNEDGRIWDLGRLGVVGEELGFALAAPPSLLGSGRGFLSRPRRGAGSCSQEAPSTCQNQKARRPEPWCPVALGRPQGASNPAISVVVCVFQNTEPARTPLLCPASTPARHNLPIEAWHWHPTCLSTRHTWFPRFLGKAAKKKK